MLKTEMQEVFMQEIEDFSKHKADSEEIQTPYQVSGDSKGHQGSKQYVTVHRKKMDLTTKLDKP